MCIAFGAFERTTRITRVPPAGILGVCVGWLVLSTRVSGDDTALVVVGVTDESLSRTSGRGTSAPVVIATEKRGRAEGGTAGPTTSPRGWRVVGP